MVLKIEKKEKNIFRILTEALIVGLLLIIVYNPLKYIFKDINYNIILFISGALFHIICAYSGINIWYVKDYNNFLKEDIYIKN